MTIAWQNLEPIQIAQLLHFRPDLQFQADLATGVPPRCQMPNCGGYIFDDDGELKCMLCGQVFNEKGQRIRTIPGEFVVAHIGTGFHKGGK